MRPRYAYVAEIEEVGVQPKSPPNEPAIPLPNAAKKQSSIGSTEDLTLLSSKLTSIETNEDGMVTPKKDFKDVRSMHYNEFEMLKRWKEEHAGDDDEEDED